jgi:hypothetical protein
MYTEAEPESPFRPPSATSNRRKSVSSIGSVHVLDRNESGIGNQSREPTAGPPLSRLHSQASRMSLNRRASSISFLLDRVEYKSNTAFTADYSTSQKSPDFVVARTTKTPNRVDPGSEPRLLSKQTQHASQAVQLSHDVYTLPKKLKRKQYREISRMEWQQGHLWTSTVSLTSLMNALQSP